MYYHRDLCEAVNHLPSTLVEQMSLEQHCLDCQEAVSFEHKGNQCHLLSFFPVLLLASRFSAVNHGIVLAGHEVLHLSITVCYVHQPVVHICVFDSIQSALVCACVHELMHVPMCPFACMHI